MTVPVRLAKRLVELITCSRREAELYITGGWVMVDGIVVEEPQFMITGQEVTLHPDASLTPIEPATLLFHHTDETTLINPQTHSPDDTSGIHKLRQHFFKLTPCIPLERGATGLTVVTQDFRIARKLHDEANTIEQEYIVEVSGDLIVDGLKQLNHGLKFNGKPLAPTKVSWQNETRLRFALKGVIPGQITAMCEKVGLNVISMKRIRIGRISMAKLPVGLWRYMMPHERF
jgi:23S rRNA pseudouridine2604 synthase